MSSFRPSHRRSHRVRVVTAVLALGVASTTACTGSDGESTSRPADSARTSTTTPATSRAPQTPRTSEPSTTAPTEPVARRLGSAPARPRTRVTRVYGRWPANLDGRRTRLVEQQTGRVVHGWLDAAFVSPDYPTERIGGAFAGFTPGARREARRQDRLTTNIVLGRQLVDAVPVRRRVLVSAVAPGGQAVGATADITFVLRGLRPSGRRSDLSLSGQVFLARVDGNWRIFGYELRRSVRPGDGGQGARR